MKTPERNPVRAVKERAQSLRLGVGIATAVARMGKTEMLRAGVLEDKQPTGLSGWLYRLYFAVVFVVVLILPAYAQEPYFYFPAILALSSAWLLAAPMYGQTLLTSDLSALRPGPGLWKAFVTAVAKEGVPVSAEAQTAEVEATMAELLPKAVPPVVSLTILQQGYKMSVRAASVAFIGLIGLLIGPTLASIHWWRGWSPVSLLYAMSMPGTILLLFTLVVPLILQVYIASRMSERVVAQDAQASPSKGSPHGDGAGE